LHGLRKTLGKALAEHRATTRELMDMLGHDNIEHAELYSREAEQRLMASSAMEKIWNWRRKTVGEPPANLAGEPFWNVLIPRILALPSGIEPLSPP
jgi:hypothetical protein